MPTPSISVSEQLSTVLRMSAGWHWVQDANFRFVSVSSGVTLAGQQAEFFIGKTRRELPNLMDSEFWDNHQRVLDAHKPFYGIEYRIAGLDGNANEPRWISLSGEPLLDAGGNFVGYQGFAQDITGRKRARMAVIASERRFDDFAGSLSDWLWETDADLCFTWVSSAVHDVLNLNGMRHIGLRMDHFHFGDKTDLDAAHKVDEAIRNRQPFRDFVFCVENAGHEVWVAKSGTPYVNANGEFAGYRGVNRDVTQQRQADLLLKEREHRFSSIFEQSPFGMIEWNEHFHIAEWNAAAERIFGWSREDVLGQHVQILVDPQHHATVDSTLRKALADTHKKTIWGQNVHKSGRPLVCSWTNTHLRDAQNKIIGTVSMVEDLTEQRHVAQRMEHVSRHDALTGLPNRAHVMSLLDAAISDSVLSRKPCAAMLINLDHFKLINESLGHAIGDHVLQEGAKRLRAALPKDAVVARFGGDEFAVLLSENTGEVQLQSLAAHLLARMHSPYVVNDEEIECTPSIGIACFPEDGQTPADLMQSADAAMRHAKAQGRNKVHFFTLPLRQAAEDRKTLGRDLRNAAKRGELLLHYQPQVNPAGAVTGVEALVRWQHPRRGLISPAQFIPLAEESGLIEDIGSWVLNEACHTMQQWLAAGLRGVCMSVNLSALQLKNTNLVQRVQDVLRSHGLDGPALELELTESMAMSDPHATIGLLQRLRGLGVGLAIDDFGTGYSSLSYLKQLPIQRLKLDKSFVDEIASKDGDATICSATIALAHKLNLSVVAEGVAYPVQRDCLVRDGCDTLQGYLFSRPVVADDALRYALDHPPLTA